jgi:glycosyltransferase involved in cell wall biosynthesis
MDSAPSDQLPSFCVVVPMYNEERGGEAAVRTICAALQGMPNRCRLLVVNDGSRDRTGAILDGLLPQFGQLSVIHHPGNAGYGAALRTGMREAVQAGFDYALFMDSDLTNNPADLPKFAAAMRDGWDVIKATRYSKGGGVQGVPAYRVLISRAGNLLARLLYGLPLADCTNGFRAVKTGLLRRMELSERKFPIIMEELYYCKLLAATATEIPVILTDRQAGQRRTSFVYRPGVFWDYLKYPLKSFLGCRRRSKSA